MTRVVRQRAFTLIEVLIALSLTGLVVVTATRMARFSLELEQQVRRQDLLQIRADVLFDQIQEDLQGILQDSTAAAALSAPPGTLLQLQNVCMFSMPDSMEERLL